MAESSFGRPGLTAVIDHWVDVGIVTSEQAARMRADQGLSASVPAGVGTQPVPPVRPVPPWTAPPVQPVRVERTSLVIEALGYLGGVIVLVAAGLLAAQYWADLSTAGRLAVIGSAAALLLGAALAVPYRLAAVGVRLRAVLLLLSTAALAAFLSVFGGRVLDWQGEDVALFAGAGTAAYAAVLWWRRPSPLQHIATLAALLVTAGTAAAKLQDPFPYDSEDYLPGLAIWGVGAVWFLIGWGGLLRPRRMVFVLGGVAALIGATVTMSTDGGIVFALVTVAVLVSLAVLFRDLVLLAVGAYGALQVLPAAIGEWFPGEVTAALVLLVIGGLLVGAAIYTARRRRDLPEEEPRRDYSAGPARVALVAAGAVAAATLTAVLVLGLT